MPLKDDAYYASLPDDAVLWGGPSMFSTEGDDAVREALDKICSLVDEDSTIRNRKGLLAAAKPVLKAVEAVHPEMSDTEPDGWIAAHLAKICDEMGWAYDKDGWLRDEFDWRYA